LSLQGTRRGCRNFSHYQRINPKFHSEDNAETAAKEKFDYPFLNAELYLQLLNKPDMSFVLKFKPAGFTAAKYDETVKQLEAAGAGAPKGRSYHVCYGDPNGVNVTDVWDSMEDFQAFGETLVPIMQSLNVDPGQPDIQQVHNIIKG
jgi:hypothetical protein